MTARLPVRLHVAAQPDRYADARNLMLLAEREGWRVTIDWTAIPPKLSTSRDEYWQFQVELAQRYRKHVADSNVLVVLLSRGHQPCVEFGIALGLGIPVLLVAWRHSEFEVPFNCFYGHPSVRRLVLDVAGTETQTRTQLFGLRILHEAKLWEQACHDSLYGGPPGTLPDWPARQVTE